eukprot:TRINITY_DN2625_c0_g1_i1.p1 TRINITY_DN2625_c0_g1~~TRINITY_DN2625_c0_g1_i1.p1  ORF type:complete len:274 (+),score=50.62 TRINITY_DN2625_c0_g1_i1:198-1019(+)
MVDRMLAALLFLQLFASSGCVQFTDNQLVASTETADFPAYQIDMTSNTSNAAQWPTPNYRRFEMRSYSGHSYHCYTPTSQFSVTGLQSGEDTARIPALREATHKLLGKCHEYRMQSAYWWYEVCHGSKVTQFHQETPTAERTKIHLLGVYERNQTSPEEPQHVYGGGDSCELPNKTLVKRSVVVKFKCERKYKGFTRKRLEDLQNSQQPVVRVVAIDEPKPCTYELLVYSHLACSIPEQSAGQLTKSPQQLVSRSCEPCTALIVIVSGVLACI